MVSKFEINIKNNIAILKYYIKLILYYIISDLH